MTNGYRLLAIAGLWMMQAAYADIGTGLAGSSAMGRDESGSGVCANRIPRRASMRVLERLGLISE